MKLRALAPVQGAFSRNEMKTVHIAGFRSISGTAG